MRYVVLGTTSATKKVTEALIKESHHVSVVSMPKEFCPLNSIDLYLTSRQFGLPYFETKNINFRESAKFLADQSPDFIVSTWPKIIRKDIFMIPKYCTIGTHPTGLPNNRGRHPLHWLIVLGIKKAQ